MVSSQKDKQGLKGNDATEKRNFRKRIAQRTYNELAFREKIRASMQYDNATLLFPNGLANSVNLDSGFFTRAARRIYTFKTAAFKRKMKIGRKIPINEEHIFAEHDGISVLGLLRTYGPTNPGKRSLKYRLDLVSAEKDVDVDRNGIAERARERYHINSD